MPFVRVYVHFVWTTKNRIPFLTTKELREQVWYHIRDNALEKGIYVDTVNGYQEHCHCLVSLGPQQTLSNTMKMIKGESSRWINKNGLCKFKFDWQDEYYAVSVSPGQLDAVREYIRNQEQHHRKQNFQEEFDTYLKKLGFERFKDGSVGRIKQAEQPRDEESPPTDWGMEG